MTMTSSLRLATMMMLMLGIVAVAAMSSTSASSSESSSSSSSESLLTFFDHDHFGYSNIVASASAVITTRNEQQQQQQQQPFSVNISDTNSKSPSFSFVAATTPSPSSSSSSTLDNDNGKMPKLCEHQPWTKLCQSWFIPTITPTDSPSTMEPTTNEPTLFPSVDFTVEKESVVMNSSSTTTTTDDVNSSSQDNSMTTTANSNTTNSSTIVIVPASVDNNNNDNNIMSNNNVTIGTSNSTNNIKDQENSITTTITNFSITYKLTPMDDTFLEVFRPKEVLGSKTKLKVDAEKEWVDDDDNDDDTLGEEAAVPTKFVQLKFGLKQVLEEMTMTTNNGTETVEEEVELISAKLHLFALTSSSFGGYVTVVPSEKKKKNEETEAVSWKEESAVWSDYVKGGGGGRGGKKVLPNDKNPEISRVGQVLADQWYEADVLDAVLNIMKQQQQEEEDVVEDDDDDGIGPKGKMDTENTLFSTTKSLSLRISTNSTDGVIYASKEHPSGNGPYLELQFIVRNSTTTTATITNVTTTASTNNGTDNVTITSSGKPSLSPSISSIPVVDRPFKPGQENETGRTPIVENSTVLEESVVNSTSVVSSSFRMTITAIEPESIRRGRMLTSLLRRGYRHAHPKNDARVLKGDVSSKEQQLQQPTLSQKEEPAIIEHLTRVFNEILTIAPIDISLVYEENLEVEYMSADNSKRDAGGVIRKSVFRIMAVFDQPEVSNMLSNDAAKVLDQATIYAFVGPEEEEFIKVFKNTGNSIVKGEDNAEYDVTVLKVKYSKADKEDVQTASSANREDSDSDATGNNSSSTSSSASWLNPTLIAGASAICLASAAAAILLWRQRHGGDYYSNNDQKKADDSPRSLSEATVPSTPSPTSFIIDRFKNKKRFDYAQFEDVGMDAENASTNNDVVSSPITTSHNKIHEQPCAHQQPTNNIKFPECQNISFDDSSVSDVSAHVLGAKGSHRRVDLYANQAESLLLDASMESYNMEAMSALEHVRFENVLDMDEGYSLTSSTYKYTVGGGGGGIAKVASEDTYGEDGSLSTGAVPSEMYSNPSMEDSLVYSHDNNSSSGGGGDVAYAGHLFTLDMLRDKDKSLMVMPPPPSDVASDSSSQKDDLEEDYDIVENNCSTTPVGGGMEDIPRDGGKNEQESITQSITDELTKVMQLLRSPYDELSDEEGASHMSVNESVMHIGTVAGHNTRAEEEEENVPLTASSHNDAEPPNTAVAVSEVDDCYDGLNVLMTDEPIVYGGEDVNGNEGSELDGNSNHYLTQMNETVSECMNILDKAAQLQNSELSTTVSQTGNADAAADTTDAVEMNVAVTVLDDETSLVTQTLD